MLLSQASEAYLLHRADAVTVGFALGPALVTRSSSGSLKSTQKQEDMSPLRDHAIAETLRHHSSYEVEAAGLVRKL